MHYVLCGTTIIVNVVASGFLYFSKIQQNVAFTHRYRHFYICLGPMATFLNIIFLSMSRTNNVKMSCNSYGNDLKLEN